MKKYTCTGTHLSLSDRIFIENALAKQLNFKEIARYLQKDPTTVSKEIKRHRIEKIHGSPEYGIHCALESTCKITDLCSNDYCENGSRCAICKLSNCTMYCDEYVPAVCEKLCRPPYVCNGCIKVRSCGYDKLFYRAKYADDSYHERLIKCRQGINQTPEDLEQIDKLVSPLILKGQSLAHIYASHHEELPCCKRTLYNYMERNLLSAKNIDLPRKVRYKKRKTKTERKDRKYKEGRTYYDYLKFMGDNPEVKVVQMDTVEGTMGGKVLLTLLFCNCSLMLMFLMESKTQECVKNVFDMLEEKLGTTLFQKLFTVILTDNGTEFQDPSSLEVNCDGEIRTKLFYCNPSQSWQKGQLERNHEFIRYIIPKGKTFDNLTDNQVLAMCNHINSLARESLNNSTPYAVAPILLDKDFMKKLGLHHIPHDEVLLRPILIKHY